MLSTDTIQHSLKPYAGMKKVIAYSGGVDSHVLLHLIAQESEQDLLVVHINHRLHNDSDTWQQHCQTVANQLGVSFQAVTIDVTKKPRHSLEAIAREARYAAFKSFINDDAILLTGHNQNDQVETVLLQLMRGAGAPGLSGMPFSKPFANGNHIRPLLAVTRDDIMVYAKTHNLTWIEDPSNEQDHFDRNFLRQKIIPELVARREGVVHTIARSSQLMAETIELSQALAQIDYQNVKGPEAHLVSIELLKSLSDARQNNVIRYWLALQGLRMPSHALLHQIKKQLLHSDLGSKPVICWGESALTRSHQGKPRRYFLCLK